ncbi:MAG: TatD family nuclease-associated radical SAM protein [Pseudomonadota bacterium]
MTLTLPASNPQIVYCIGDNLYINLTDRCTLRCRFCPKHNGSRVVQGYDLTLDHRPALAEILAALDDPAAYREVVFCGYGEPTLRLDVLVVVAHHIKALGGRVRVNTDGLGDRVHKNRALPAMQGCVDALSVSLNAQDAETYDRHCAPQLRGSFEAMLAFLRRAPHFVPEVTATAINGLPGVDIPACERLAHDLGVGFRCRVLDQVG